MHDKSGKKKRSCTISGFRHASPFWDVPQHKLVVTDVSGQPIGRILKGQAVQEDGTYRLSRNVGNYQFMLRNVPRAQKQRFLLYFHPRDTHSQNGPSYRRSLLFA
jgi:hypothetical protein